jgi:hypothetical protein
MLKARGFTVIQPKQTKPPLPKNKPRVADPDEDDIPPWESSAKKRPPKRTMSDVVPKLAAKKASEPTQRKARRADPVEDLDPDPPSRQVRPQRTAPIVLADQSAPRRNAVAPRPKPVVVPDAQFDQESVKALKSRFGNKAQTILDMLDSDEETDGAVSLLSRSLVQTLVGVLPMAESNVRESRGAKGIYQLNQLVSGIREMMVDLQALRDKGNLGRSVVDRHVRPAYMDMSVQVMQSFTLIESFAQSRMKSADYREFRAHVDEVKKNLAGYLTAQYADLREGVASSLT